MDKGTGVNRYADPAGTFDVLVSVDGLASERSSRGRWAVRAGAHDVLSREPSGDSLLAPGTERDDGVRQIVLTKVE